jgi:hypothetical protein
MAATDAVFLYFYIIAAYIALSIISRRDSITSGLIQLELFCQQQMELDTFMRGVCM